LRQHARFVAALFLVALALRPQIIGVGPLIPSIQDHLGISHTVAGLLATIPVLCMGLFAPAAAYVAGGIGARAAIGFAVALIAVGGLLRVSVPEAAVLILLTLPVGIGIAVAGTLMPTVVKGRLAGSTPLASSSVRRSRRPSPCRSPTSTAAGGSRSARSRSRRRSRRRCGSC
jgi:cyanate permease